MIESIEDWFWEGSIQGALVEHLLTEGWTIDAAADTASRQRGIDVLASKDDRRLAVEVKGFPSTRYARGKKAGLPKPTAPALQARHWFAGALLTAIVTRSKFEKVELALAFPDVARFRNLIEQARWALEQTGIGIYLIQEGGGVEILLDHERAQ